MDALLNIPRKC